MVSKTAVASEAKIERFQQDLIEQLDAEKRPVRVLPSLTAAQIAEQDIRLRSKLWLEFGESMVEPDGTSKRQHDKCLEKQIG